MKRYGHQLDRKGGEEKMFAFTVSVWIGEIQELSSDIGQVVGLEGGPGEMRLYELFNHTHV
jgi:hypothetical protein